MTEVSQDSGARVKVKNNVILNYIRMSPKFGFYLTLENKYFWCLQ